MDTKEFVFALVIILTNVNIKCRTLKKLIFSEHCLNNVFLDPDIKLNA